MRPNRGIQKDPEKEEKELKGRQLPFEKRVIQWSKYEISENDKYHTQFRTCA
jgi:hypothetical protein